MKKSILAIVAVAALVAFSSARYTSPADSRLGAPAPQLMLAQQGDSIVDLQSFRGHYVLLTFWSSAQPDSRLANLRYHRVLASDPKVAHVAMNLDRSEGVYRQTLVADGLSDAAQYRCSDDARTQTMRTWRQSEEALSSLLIAPDGTIAAINPTVGDLRAL